MARAFVSTILTLGAVAFTAATGAGLARAQPAGDFYAGKTIEITVGSSVGAGYDLYARLLARHWGRRIPGAPTIVVKNMDGAGGLRAANWLWGAGAKDGASVGTFGRGISLDPLTGLPGANFDATKFGWIGSMNDEVSACVSWQTSGVTKFSQLFERELTVGASGRSGDSYQFPAIINGVLGTKMKIVTGYPGGSEIDLAMERGEVAGRCGWSWSSLNFTHPKWVPEGKINVLAQMALTKHPDLPDVPLVMDLAKTEEQASVMRLIFARQAMAWPYATPPGTPPERVEALRKAFNETMKDPEFRADAQKGGYEIRPVGGAEIEKLVAQLYALPKSITQRASDLLK